MSIGSECVLDGAIKLKMVDFDWLTECLIHGVQANEEDFDLSMLVKLPQSLPLPVLKCRQKEILVIVPSAKTIESAKLTKVGCPIVEDYKQILERTGCDLSFSWLSRSICNFEVEECSTLISPMCNVI